MKDAERRITRLEENSFFLEEKQEKLDAQMQIQQRQLDQLEQQIADMRAVIAQLRETAGMALEISQKIPDAPPPHYQSTTWHDR